MWAGLLVVDSVRCYRTNLRWQLLRSTGNLGLLRSSLRVSPDSVRCSLPYALDVWNRECKIPVVQLRRSLKGKV